MQFLERDGQTQSELLAAVRLDHSTVSKSLRRMQETGLFTREPAEHDERVLRVLLTDKGRALRGSLKELRAALKRVSVGTLDANTVEQFIVTSAVTLQAVVEHSTTIPINNDPHLT